MEILGYRKFCSCWVFRLLTEEHKAVRRDVSSQLLRRYTVGGDDFLLNIVKGDESWFHHFETDEAVQETVRSWLRGVGTDFYRRGIFEILQRWQKCIDRDVEFVEK
jgi:hypothetical protein